MQNHPRGALRFVAGEPTGKVPRPPETLDRAATPSVRGGLLLSAPKQRPCADEDEHAKARRHRSSIPKQRKRQGQEHRGGQDVSCCLSPWPSKTKRATEQSVIKDGKAEEVRAGEPNQRQGRGTVEHHPCSCRENDGAVDYCSAPPQDPLGCELSAQLNARPTLGPVES